MLENPHNFLRTKQPVSLSSAALESVQHRPAAFAANNSSNEPVSVAGAGINASAVSSDFSSVSSFLQGLWANADGGPADPVRHAAAPLPSISDILAPSSFGAEPQTWPLQRLDRDFVNAAFQLDPIAASSSQVTSVSGVQCFDRSTTSGPGKQSLQSAVRAFICSPLARVQRATLFHALFQNHGDSSEFHV
jgi:hypothetical protein